MRKYKTLSRDTRPQEQPAGTYPFGKNGIQDYIRGAIINEPGFLPSSAVIPYVPMGVLETDKYPVIFSTDNTNSAIGYFNIEDDTYDPILNDKDLPFKLGFSTDRPITGQAQRNYKDEVVGAFTDGYLQPFYLNFDNPQVNSLKDMLLFPLADPPVIETTIQSGGRLLPGAWYAAVKYAKKDGTETSYLTVSAPKIISGDDGQVTDKALQIVITSIDADYDQVQVAIISRIAGVTTAKQLDPLPASGAATILYTGGEPYEVITLDEVLTPMPIYNSVGSIGQLNDALYIANLKSAPALKMQKYASLIRLKWTSQLISVTPVYEKMKTGEERTFMHGEVYDFYIRYRLANGQTTQSFHIPGSALTASDLASSTTASAEGLNAKKYQAEDTIPSFSASSKSGYMGKWQNTTELYPTTDDYDASGVGGENLKGQPVRHHRFPSIRWCKENLYAGETEYGKSKLDMLGISVENVIIPSEYASQVVGWEIFYAKRSLQNSTVLGQSLLLFGARSVFEPEYQSSHYYSTGGNWNSEINFKTTTKKTLKVDQSIIHFHGFDLLFNKPDISPDYVSLELKHRRTNITGTGGYMEDGAVDAPNNGPIVYALDYTQKGMPPLVPTQKLKGLSTKSYDLFNPVPNNTKVPGKKWENQGIERFYGGVLSHPEHLIDASEIDQLEVTPSSRGDNTNGSAPANQETTFLSNLMAVRQNLYTPFTGQALVRAGRADEPQSTQVFFGGDTYICEYSFHTYGNWVSNPGFSDADLYQGTKVVRRFICETAANLYSRFEDPANQYSRYYPQSPLVPQDPENYLTNFIRNQDPNQFGYKKDSNALDDLVSTVIFNTLAEDLTEHPYRIHRGGKISRQTKFRNWRTFLPLDYYEMQKNMGKPLHIEGMDDRLLIHCENALFVTQDKAKLESDTIAVTLGSGDIFQFEPQESLSSKLGYAGTQHPLACVRTPFGYVFVDAKAGGIFIYKGKLELVNNMMNTFFMQYLRLKETNVFMGNGITIGYDPEYKRLLLTVKNRKLNSDLPVKPFDPTKLPTMTPGQVVYKNGRLQKFLGVNSTAYDCPQDVVPTATGFTTSIPEDTAIGVLVGTVTGTDVDNYFLTTSNVPFQLDPASGKLTLTGELDYYEQSQYTLQGSAKNANGNQVTFTVVVNITAINKAPVAQDGEVTILDNTPSATSIFTIQADDRESNTLTYTIVGGNPANTFSINSSTGVVTVADGSQLDALKIPSYILQINVSDGTNNATCTLTVNLTHVNRAPATTDYTITITDAAKSGSTVLQMDPADDPEGDPLTYVLIDESVPGVFTFDPSTLTIKLVDNAQLNPAVTNQYTLHLSASDGTHEPVPFTVTVNVVYDRSNLSFAPDQGSCSLVPTCAAGWTLSPDGTVCTRVTTQAPTVTQQNSCLATSTNAVYGSFGARIYNPGWTNTSISTTTPPAGDIDAVMTTPYWEGVPNDIGVWVDTDCNGSKDTLAAGVQTTMLYNYNNTGAARQVYVGVFGDNQFVLKVNDQTIAQTTSPSVDSNFKYLHIFPVNIINGQNIFNVVGTGDGSVNDAVGLIIYDNTSAELQAATADTDLAIIFSSNGLRGTSSTIATCPDGYVLDDNGGSPICKKIESTAPTQSATGTTRSWTKVKITDIKHASTVTLLNNDETAKTFQDVNVPYYPPVNESVDCGGTITLYLSAQKAGTAQKMDCTEGVGSVVIYTVPAGLHTSIVSQAEADAAAQADVDTNKQAYANLNGECNL